MIKQFMQLSLSQYVVVILLIFFLAVELSLITWIPEKATVWIRSTDTYMQQKILILLDTLQVKINKKKTDQDETSDHPFLQLLQDELNKKIEYFLSYRYQLSDQERIQFYHGLDDMKIILRHIEQKTLPLTGKRIDSRRFLNRLLDKVSDSLNE